jgi:hypothetical protein
VTDFDDRSGRDSRLLALVILIAVAVLVVLARFRFPLAQDARPAAVTPGPLERLAARNTYDDLAAAVHTALQRVESALITVSLEPDPQPAKSPAAARTDAGGPDPRSRLAVRLSDDWAIVHVPRGFRPARTAPDDPLVVRDVDPVKEIAVVSLALREGEDQLSAGSAELGGFAYVCAVDPTPAGPTATPVFIGRVRTLLDARWGDNLIVPGAAAALTPGSLLFQLDGRLLGLVVAQPGGGVAVVPAGVLASTLASSRARVAGGSR